MLTVASVCVCLCVCNALTFESLNLESLFWYVGASSKYLEITFSYHQSHLVKVKVTGTRKRVCVSSSQAVCLRLKGNLVNCSDQIERLLNNMVIYYQKRFLTSFNGFYRTTVIPALCFSIQAYRNYK